MCVSLYLTVNLETSCCDANPTYSCRVYNCDNERLPGSTVNAGFSEVCEVYGAVNLYNVLEWIICSMHAGLLMLGYQLYIFMPLNMTEIQKHCEWLL